MERFSTLNSMNFFCVAPQTEFAGQPLSTHEFIHAVVAAFFVSRVEELLLEKSKITFRWNRAVSNKEVSPPPLCVECRSYW